jgi:hypothetical protein
MTYLGPSDEGAARFLQLDGSVCQECGHDESQHDHRGCKKIIGFTGGAGWTTSTDFSVVCKCPGYRSSSGLGVRPASTLVPLYEARLAHAEANLKYWNDEYARHGDPIAEASWRAAQKTVGDVWQKLNMLKQPGAVVRDDA